MHLVYFNHVVMQCFDTVCRNVHSSPSPVTDAFSKYLVQYELPPPVEKNTAYTRVTGSRVLTSAEGYAILHEKEEKKRKEKEEKNRRKQEREKCEKQEAFRKRQKKRQKITPKLTTQRTRHKGRTWTTNASTIAMLSFTSHDGVTWDLPSESTESDPATPLRL